MISSSVPFLEGGVRVCGGWLALSSALGFGGAFLVASGAGERVPVGAFVFKFAVRDLWIESLVPPEPKRKTATAPTAATTPKPATIRGALLLEGVGSRGVVLARSVRLGREDSRDVRAVEDEERDFAAL